MCVCFDVADLPVEFSFCEHLLLVFVIVSLVCYSEKKTTRTRTKSEESECLASADCLVGSLLAEVASRQGNNQETKKFELYRRQEV